MKLKTKILLVVTLLFVSMGIKCPKGGGGSNQCSAFCNVGSTYSIIYQDGGCTRDREVACYAGSLSYPRDCNGSCNAYVREKRFFFFGLTADPSGANLNSPPTALAITGQGMDGTYGMPRLDFFDSDGFLFGTVYATSVGSDGSWLQAPVPDLSSVYTGTYSIQVTNTSSEGFYTDVVGTATLSGWGRDPVDSDGDGVYDNEDCYPYDPSRWLCDGGGGGGGDDGCTHDCYIY